MGTRLSWLGLTNAGENRPDRHGLFRCRPVPAAASIHDWKGGIVKWSFPIGSFAGTVVRVHLTLLILLAWIGFAYYALGGPSAALSGLVFILLIFVCVTLHEFGHVLVARYYGVRTPDIILLPIGGASRMEEIPANPKQEALIGIAGPLVSLAIAGLLIAVMGQWPNVDDLAPESLADRIIPVPQLAFVNLLLAAFNLLPAFPMDGGRVLRAVLSTRMSRLRATRVAALLGKIFAIVFGIVGLLAGDFILLLIAVFVFVAAVAESGDVRLDEAARGMAAEDGMIAQFESLPVGATIADALDALMRTTQSEFPVLDSNGHLQGILTRRQMISALQQHGHEAPVRQFMETEIPVVSRLHALERALHHFRGGAPAVGVTDTGGRLLGYITMQNLIENMMISEARIPKTPFWGLARRS